MDLDLFFRNDFAVFGTGVGPLVLMLGEEV